MDGTTGATAGAPTQSAAPTQSQSQPTQTGNNTPTQSSNKSAPNPSQASEKQQSHQEIYEVPINGKIVKMTRQELMNEASKSRAANDKFNEASKMRKESEQMKARAQKDFIEFLQDPSMGLSKDQIKDRFEKWYYDNFIEPESLNEDQKRIREYESKLKKYEEEEKSKKQREQEEQDRNLTNQQIQFLNQEIIETMEKSGLPKSPFLVSRMAFYMRQNALNGWDAPKEMIIKQVQNERQNIMSDITENSTGEQLISLLGDAVVNKIRKYDLEQIRSRRSYHQQPASGRAGTGVVSSDKISSSEVQKRLNDIKRGKL